MIYTLLRFDFHLKDQADKEVIFALCSRQTEASQMKSGSVYSSHFMSGWHLISLTPITKEKELASDLMMPITVLLYKQPPCMCMASELILPN